MRTFVSSIFALALALALASAASAQSGFTDKTCFVEDPVNPFVVTTYLTFEDVVVDQAALDNLIGEVINLAIMPVDLVNNGRRQSETICGQFKMTARHQFMVFGELDSRYAARVTIIFDADAEQHHFATWRDMMGIAGWYVRKNAH